MPDVDIYYIFTSNQIYQKTHPKRDIYHIFTYRYLQVYMNMMFPDNNSGIITKLYR